MKKCILISSNFYFPTSISETYNNTMITLRRLILLPDLHRLNLETSCVLDILRSNHIANRQHVELVIIGIKLSELEPEDRSTHERQHSHGAIVPDKKGISAERDKCLTNSSRDSRHEEGESLNKGSHVARGFGESVFERRDASEDLRDGDENISTGLSPDIDVDCWASHGTVAAERSGEETRGVVPAHRFLVDVVLDDGCPDHGQSAGVETCSDFLDGAEVDLHLSQDRVEPEIADWDEDDECEGIEVGEDVIGETVQGHNSGLRGKVVVQLVVGDPVKWIPQENGTSCESTLDLIDPLVVEGHPGWSARWLNCGWLHEFPEGAIIQALIC